MSRLKIYYPKSGVQTNLYTPGKEWMTDDGNEYIGYYHRYIDGTVLTEAVYSKLHSKSLVPYISSVDQPDISLYLKAKGLTRPVSPKAPQFYYPDLSLDDYQKGKFTRYLLKRSNQENNIIEISEESFLSWSKPDFGIDNFLYKCIELEWKLTGIKYDSDTEKGVYNTNRRIVEFKDKVFPGLKKYLTDPLEFTIYSNLTSPDIRKYFST